MSANTGPRSAASFENFLQHLGHCSSVGRVTDTGTGVQRFNPSISQVFFIFNDISFKWGNETKGEQKEKQLLK